MKIAGYLKSSLIDYPDTLASVVYSPKCNFNCGFCHNKDLVYNSDEMMHQNIVLKHLKKRSKILDGVVISGGEPTLQQNLKPFIRDIKSLGYKVKLDTNGYKPEILENLIKENLIDYIAMDIKNSPCKYQQTVDKMQFDIETIKQSIEVIKRASVDYEFRTTWIKEYHDDNDIIGIGSLIKDSKRYVLQQYEFSDKQIRNEAFNYYTLDEMSRFQDEFKVQYNVEEVLIRGRF
ncbi:MAG: anaerobic ribonucleoside-triphosphate reductase activating protein [Clostridiales bacterium]|nr:anaerobic ribonucleoside-triphosphate reductase activating protein [Clostridiales bacterium]